MNTPCSISSIPLTSGRHTHTWRTLLITLLLAPAILPAQVQSAASGATEPAKDNKLTAKQKKLLSELIDDKEKQ